MCRYPVGKLKESEQGRPAEVSKRKEQVGQFFAKLAEMQDAEQFEVREFVAQGVKVVALGHYRWRVKFTGHSYANDWLHVFTIHDAKVSNFQEYLDTHAWAAAYRSAQSSAGR
jgi:uncharacterized protein